MSDAARSNGFDAKQLQQHLSTIDDADEELNSLLGEYRASCRGPKGRIKNVMAIAKEQGLPMVAFRQVVAMHRAQRRFDHQVAGLEADDADHFDAMLSALDGLADTPLGAAALSAARRRDRGEETLASLS